MYSAQFWSTLKDRIEERIATEEHSLGSGNASSFDQYKRQCGIIEGLKFCIEQARDILGEERGRTRQRNEDDE